MISCVLILKNKSNGALKYVRKRCFMLGIVLFFLGIVLLMLIFIFGDYFDFDVISISIVIVIGVGMMFSGISLNDSSNSKTTMDEITDAISSEYPSAEIINESKYVNEHGYIKFADGGIYTYEYENGILFIKDINGANDVKNIIQIKKE